MFTPQPQTVTDAEIERRTIEHKRQFSVRVAEAEAARAEAQRQREADALATLTEDLKDRYMNTTGATEAGFRTALPDLLEENRRDEMRRQDAGLARARRDYAAF